jgi:hypothetical protein
MRLRNFAVLGLILLPFVSRTQEKEPTVEQPAVEQCRADFTAWSSIAHGIDTDSVMQAEKEEQAAAKKLSVPELTRRRNEMFSCMSRDQNSLQYLLKASRYGSAINDRMVDFIARHNLTAQFLAEDAAGER